MDQGETVKAMLLQSQHATSAIEKNIVSLALLQEK